MCAHGYFFNRECNLYALAGSLADCKVIFLKIFYVQNVCERSHAMFCLWINLANDGGLDNGLISEFYPDLMGAAAFGTILCVLSYNRRPQSP